MFTFMILAAAPAKKIPGEWQEQGVLAYDYTYAKSVMGFRMRKDGWSCKLGFTTGPKGEQEHSVWTKGNRKKQLMIWRIDTGKTAYRIGEVRSAGRKEGK